MVEVSLLPSVRGGAEGGRNVRLSTCDSKAHLSNPFCAITPKAKDGGLLGNGGGEGGIGGGDGLALGGGTGGCILWTYM